MRLTVKNRDELIAQIEAYIASGGEITREDPQTATKTLRRAMSLASRHLGKHNFSGARV